MHRYISSMQHVLTTKVEAQALDKHVKKYIFTIAIFFFYNYNFKTEL